VISRNASERVVADPYRCSALFAELKLTFQVHGCSPQRMEIADLSHCELVVLLTEMVENSVSFSARPLKGWRDSQAVDHISPVSKGENNAELRLLLLIPVFS
jgi:hypothetical protein